MTGSLASCPAATMPHARAVFPVTLVYSPSGRCAGRTSKRWPDGLGGLAEVVAGEERRPVGGGDLLVGGEPALDPVERRLGGPGVHPRHETEGEEVLRPLGVAWLDPEWDGGLLGEAGHRHLDHPVAVEAAIVEGVRRRARRTVIAGLEQVALLEGVLVDDQRPPDLEPAEVGAQRRRVHRHQHVRFVAGRGDRVVGDVHLEAGDAVHGAGRGADLGRELGQRREVVAVLGGHRGESVAGELHPVAGVSGEAHDHPIEDLRVPHPRRLATCRGLGCVSHLVGPASLPSPSLNTR